jgi:excinuclease ABC subunit A
MQFLSDVFIRCPDCGGRRYRGHILEIQIRNPKSEIRTAWSIADLLDATVEEVVAFLSGFPDSKPAQRAVQSLRLLEEVGLGYLRLGQPINTLSGGESQRLKLVRHLAEAGANPKSENRNPKETRSPKPDERQAPVAIRTSEFGLPSGFGIRDSGFSRPTLFLFDEPTTGLHFADVRLLLGVFHRLVDAGHSVLVIEHNLEVLKCADWVIDLGPEAGAGGGRIVAQGTPEEVAACAASHTGRALSGVLR